MPAVSVIIPAYNRASFLREAMDSVLGQTYRDFELIIIDDGSTDVTKEVVDCFRTAGSGRPLHYLYQANEGVSSARNQGLSLATGRYVSFLDSDDLWHRDKLRIQTEFFQGHPRCSVCYTEEIWIRKGVRVNPMKKHAKHSGWIFEQCLSLCIISPSSVMMDRTIFDEVGGFDETFPVCEDYELWLRVTSRYPVHLVDRRLITKRGGHPDQLSHKSWGNDVHRVRALQKILHEGNLKQEWQEMALQELKRKSEILYQGFMKRGNREEAEKYHIH